MGEKDLKTNIQERDAPSIALPSFSRCGDILVVASQCPDFHVDFVDCESGETIHTVQLFQKPIAIATTVSGKRLAITLSETKNKAGKLETKLNARHQIVNVIRTHCPHGELCYNRDENHLYHFPSPYLALSSSLFARVVIFDIKSIELDFSTAAEYECVLGLAILGDPLVLYTGPGSLSSIRSGALFQS